MLQQMFFYKFMGIDFYHTAYSFFFYGFVCWIMETIFEWIRTKKLTKRGFLKGPICTIYGVAWLFVYFVMKPLDGRWLVLYIVGTIYATVLEYVTGVLLEKKFHQRWWDYSDFPLNFQGQICLLISLAWGVLVVTMFAFMQPMVMQLINLIPVGIGFPVIVLMIWLYFMDIAFSFAAKSRFGAAMKEKLDDKKEAIKYHFQK
jgi:uncharacterized membrane protein